jgi:peptidoglycan hydrolase-like protein with peptidoglycan-binding domain
VGISIFQSVGQGGLNRRDDVIAVQRHLNLVIGQLGLRPLAVDGAAGRNTIAAIIEFQRRIAKLSMADGRIDPNGRTLKALNSVGAAVGPAPAPGGLAPGSPATVTVTYKTDVPAAARIVSNYGMKVIERAVSAAGMRAAVITSTLRLPAEQAEIMYRNAAQNLVGQYRLYGSTGDQVLDVYKQNKAKPKAEVVKLMETKIEELAAKGQRVSNHVTTVAKYAALNIVDIGVGSTTTAAGPTFNKAKLTEAFRKLETDGYIRRFIDETAKTNQCWHLEIVPDAKPLP